MILGRVKEILRLRKDFKVIVTSASLDTELFKEFGMNIDGFVRNYVMKIVDLYNKSSHQ